MLNHIDVRNLFFHVVLVGVVVKVQQLVVAKGVAVAHLERLQNCPPQTRPKKMTTTKIFHHVVQWKNFDVKVDVNYYVNDDHCYWLLFDTRQVVVQMEQVVVYRHDENRPHCLLRHCYTHWLH